MSGKSPVVIVDGKKPCSRCGETKALDEFHVHSQGLGGRQSRCKACTNIERRDFRALHPERHKELDKARYPDRKRQMRDRFLRKTYDISIEDYEWMVDQQDGLCAICLKEPVGEYNLSILHVDHDHQIGFNRSLLCQRCNLAIGQFDEDIEVMQRAINYIRFYREIFEGVA